MMRALAADRLGPPEVYEVRELPVPVPGEGEVLLRVEATGLGYVDALIAAGGYQHRPEPPYVPGAEIVGTIERLGPGAQEWSIGDRVASWQLLAGGGLAEYAVARGRTLVRVPASLDARVAAGSLLDPLTAWYALHDRGGLCAGEAVLVLGASGGVGAAAVRIAASFGARVIAAASTSSKRERALEAGAELAIDYMASDWRDVLRSHAPCGIDVVVDPVGGAIFEPAFRSLAKGGRHLVLGFAGGEVPRLPANLPLLKNGMLVGADARDCFERSPARAIQIWDQVFARLASGQLRSADPWLHTFEQAQASLSDALLRHKRGKIVVDVDR